MTTSHQSDFETGNCVGDALLIALRNPLEHNPATVYKAVYVGEMASAIQSCGWSVQCLDFDTRNLSLTDLIAAFSKSPKVVLLWAEVHQARLAKQVAHVAKSVDPNIKIFVYGRATAFIPQYFERFPFDAVHISGDREAAIADYVRFLRGELDGPSGVSIRHVDNDSFQHVPGRRAGPDDWPYPDLGVLPLDDYREFTTRVHGNNYSPRIAITVSKGCHLACAYCGATHEEGKSDRRRSVSDLFSWIDMSGFYQRSEMLHLFASNLFVDLGWIEQFCRHYNENAYRFSWRGVTTIQSLQNPEIVALAGANGCSELAVGIETLRLKSLSTAKSTLEELENAVIYCKRANINIKGLVMLGYPGQTEQEVVKLEEIAQDWKITLRYTGYTPLHRLRALSMDDLDRENLESYDRRTYFDEKSGGLSRRFFFDRLTSNRGYYVPSKEPIAVGDRFHDVPSFPNAVQ